MILPKGKSIIKMSTMRTYDYKCEAVLGTGTFGSVFLVRRRKDGKPFVIKKQDVSGNAITSFEMVLGEIQCLQQMRHPNIVAYHGAWREGSRCYILMEYATRGTLKDLLARMKNPLKKEDLLARMKNPLKKEDGLYLFSQVVLGVHHIHSKKVLHRDLKPENIMLTGRRGDIVKIGDFGVSKNLQEGLSTNVAGSYYYMAPEMLQGQPCDFKCDIWSMGVVLYEMITKALPFPATSQAGIVEMVCNGKPQKLPKGTSEDVVNLISKMLRKVPVLRPRATQLLLCPHLVPFISRVHLNLGRIPGSCGSESTFQSYLK